jgi:hypothetical protein
MFFAYLVLWLFFTSVTKLVVYLCGHRFTWRFAALVTAAVTIPLYYG